MTAFLYQIVDHPRFAGSKDHQQNGLAAWLAPATPRGSKPLADRLRAGG
jgi:hypothetical protein